MNHFHTWLRPSVRNGAHQIPGLFILFLFISILVFFFKVIYDLILDT